MKKKTGVIAAVVVIGLISFFMLSHDKGNDGGTVGGGMKDEIIYCQGNDITTMDINQGIQERACALTNNMFDSLFTFDEDMKVIPSLATEYKWADDKTLELKLRQDVKFHDGTTMTPEDVAFTLNRINEKGALFGDVYQGTEIVDGSTIRIKLKSPSPVFVNLLAVPYAGIVPQKVVEADPDGFGKNPVGTGPYKFKEAKEGDYYTLERFDDCWSGKAKTKLLTLKIVPETAQRSILLETGDVDAAYEIAPSNIKRIQDDKNLKVLTCNTMKIIMLNMNCESKGPVGNVKVRKAIAAAIDKNVIVDQLLHGYGRAANSMIPPEAKEYEEQPIDAYDPEQSKKLLAEAGYPNGCKIRMITDGAQTNTEAAQVIQSQLAKVGIQAELIVQDPNTTTAMLKAHQDFDIIMDFFNLVAGHADLVYKRVLYSSSSSNWCYYNNPAYDKAYDEYTVTPEGAKRDELRKKVNSFFITDVPVIPLCGEKKVIGAQGSLEGLKLSPIGSHEYQNATVTSRK